MKKKVLFIAYQIPPIGGPATQRHIRFLTRLPALDWHPVVLSVDPAYCEEYYPKDETLVSLLPYDIPIYRTKSFNPMDWLLKIKTSSTQKSGDISSKGALSACNHCSPCRNPVQFCKDIVTEIFRIPDRQIGWYLFAVLIGIRIIRKEEIKVIYSSGNPWTAHLVGMSLAKLSGLPWVADFRDPWLHNPYKEKRFTFIASIEKGMEKNVAKNASYVVANTRPLQKQFRVSYPQIDPGKFIHISNGYLASLFQNLQFKKNDKLVISHVGNLYSNRSPLPVLQAVANLKSAGLFSNDNFLLQFIGNISVSGVNQDLLLSMRIENMVRFIPPVAHDKALNHMAGSDVLLIIQPATKLQIPAKIFEYIAVGKTIFAITGEGATADLVKHENLGIVANPENIEEIENKLRFLQQEYKKDILNELYHKYSQEKFESIPLTQKLVQLFEACLNP